jgi:hypothetical protein
MSWRNRAVGGLRMKREPWFLMIVACVLAVGVACSKTSANPSAPSGAGSAATAAANANADGSTLKATAPTPQAPINGVRVPQGQAVTLVVTNSTMSYVSSPLSLSYRFEVTDSASAVVESALVAGGAGTTSRTVGALLQGDQTYPWRARPEFQALVGPWSARASFIAPANEGYIRGSEVYDPLINSKTVGNINGPVTFIPGVGVRLDSPVSYISYDLQQTLTDGEFSVLVTNVPSATAGLKTKLFAMAQGYSNITVNPRRFTIEKRGNTEAGDIAWRVIGSGGAIETIGSERRKVNFLAASTYFWRATWGPAGFRLIINNGGVTGQNVYDFSRTILGVYDPNPHVAFLGSPSAQSGTDNQSVPGATYRQVWVSRNPRPSFANQ